MQVGLKKIRKRDFFGHSLTGRAFSYIPETSSGDAASIPNASLLNNF